MLTSQPGSARSEAQPTLFADLSRNVFIAVHVDDLIVVGSNSQLCDVVGDVKQHFTIKVIHPLSDSSTRTYVGARCLRQKDSIWELPTTRYVDNMLTEHGITSANPVVTPAVARNDNNDDAEASAEGASRFETNPGSTEA